jgi:hypothetical protein
MATAEEHYTEALNMAGMVALANLHIALGHLKLEIERPGRSLILPTNHR